MFWHYHLTSLSELIINLMSIFLVWRYLIILHKNFIETFYCVWWYLSKIFWYVKRQIFIFKSYILKSKYFHFYFLYLIIYIKHIFITLMSLKIKYMIWVCTIIMNLFKLNSQVWQALLSNYVFDLASRSKICKSLV